MLVNRAVVYTNCTIYTREEMVNENWRKMISAVLCIVWRKAFRGLFPRENWEKTALWWMRYIWRSIRCLFVPLILDAGKEKEIIQHWWYELRIYSITSLICYSFNRLYPFVLTHMLFLSGKIRPYVYTPCHATTPMFLQQFISCLSRKL